MKLDSSIKFVLILMVCAVLGVVSLISYVNLIYGNYLDLDRCNNQNFKVERIKRRRGVIYFNDSLSIRAAHKKVNRKVQYLHDFVEEGDSISLSQNSDTLFLFKRKSSETHWFIYYGEPCKID